MYNVNFFKGYNDKCFIGMTSEEVIASMPDYQETYYAGENADIRKDYARDFAAYYDKDGYCNAIEFLDSNTKVFVNGEQLMGLTEVELMKKLKKMFPTETGYTDKCSYMYLKYAFAVSMVDGKAGAIFIGKKGAFDSLLKELDEPGPPSLWEF